MYFFAALRAIYFRAAGAVIFPVGKVFHAKGQRR